MPHLYGKFYLEVMVMAAATAHAVNRAYCKSIGDDSQPTWAEAPDWQKSSALNGAEAHYNNPQMTPEDSHKSWLAQKAAEGWAYGPVKDPEKKLHPCFLPYEELPPEQKTKDALFKAVMDGIYDRLT